MLRIAKHVELESVSGIGVSRFLAPASCREFEDVREPAPEEVCRLLFKLLWLGIAGIFTLVNITVKRLF